VNKPKTVTNMQFAMNLATSIFGVGILAVPRFTVDYAQTGAPMATLLAVVSMMAFGLILAYLGSQYPDMTLFEYSEKILGKWPSAFFLVLVVIYFAELAALAAREFGEVVVTSVLQRTPVEITILVMLTLAVIAARNDAAIFSRILTFYMPFVYIPALVVVALTLRSARATHILPLINILHETSPMHFLYAAVIVAALFQNYFITGLLTPFMYQVKDAWKGIIIGMGIAGGVYFTLILSTLSVFGTEEMKNLLWPTLELAKTAALPLFLLERIDPVFIAVWVTAVFTAILASFYMSVQGLAHLLGFQDHKVLTVPAMPCVFLMAMQAANVVALYRTMQTILVSGLVLTTGYPLLLLLGHWLRSAAKPKNQKKKKVQSA
jgi:spore germination protein